MSKWLKNGQWPEGHFSKHLGQNVLNLSATVSNDLRFRQNSFHALLCGSTVQYLFDDA